MISRRIISVFLAWLAFACTTGTDVPSPADLVITSTVSSDGSGLVTFTATAQHVHYFEFRFGDVPNETPSRSTDGTASHVYAASGTYSVVVTAYADEKTFISAVRSIQVEVLTPRPDTGYSTPASYPGMKLLWADEFGGTGLSDQWTFDIGDGCPYVCGWGNSELEYYRAENASVQEGYLTIEARREAFGGRNFTSSRMLTKGKFSFKYGRVDVRAALPQGQGLWPAIWMLGASIDAVSWPKCGEVDIMEMIGGDNRERTVYGTAHWDVSDTHTSDGGDYSLAQGNFPDQFHVFSIVWTSERITWYVDDIRYHEVDITSADRDEFRKEFFLLLNVAVGGSWPGNPTASTPFPQQMIVDYVRVFQHL